jgi:hypothetical protein
MQYLAKPNLFNNTNSKSFSDPLQAVLFLNEVLSDKGVPEHLDYVFVPPRATEKNLQEALEDYIGIGKIVIKE